MSKEIEHLNSTLKYQDSRNFHAWNMRRFIVARLNSSETDELKYTQDLIERDIKNYSAWHYRSVILSSVLKRQLEGFLSVDDILAQEYDLVHHAIFTDSDVQSGWFYYFWLLEQTTNVKAPFLISSGLAPGSEYLLSTSGTACDPSISPSRSYLSNQGVNSSAITGEPSASEINSVFNWRPLSTTKDSVAAWVADLEVPTAIFGSSERNPVHISCKHPKDITSLNGFQYSNAFLSKFMVHLQLLELSDTKELTIEMISWKDIDFQKYGDVDVSTPTPSFVQLKMDKDQEDAGSKLEVFLRNEIALFRSLDCKIGKLILARMLTARDRMVSALHVSSSAEPMSHFEETLLLYSDLATLDPPHSEFYADQRSSEILHQVTQTLLRHRWQCSDSSIFDTRRLICVRLNNLSLTQITSMEHLMWVQMLDFSYNELRSISGLEAMRALKCLNLSYNKLRSFTALGPLRQLKSLKVLNISHNEIGGYSIDTTRYLCSFPLSQRAASVWKCVTLPVDDIIAAKYYEAIFIFKDLKLTQLDIAGNPVIDEDFMLLLRKLLPELRWLNGCCSNQINSV